VGEHERARVVPRRRLAELHRRVSVDAVRDHRSPAEVLKVVFGALDWRSFSNASLACAGEMVGASAGLAALPTMNFSNTSETAHHPNLSTVFSSELSLNDPSALRALSTSAVTAGMFATTPVWMSTPVQSRITFCATQVASSAFLGSLQLVPLQATTDA